MRHMPTMIAASSTTTPPTTPPTIAPMGVDADLVDVDVDVVDVAVGVEVAEGEPTSGRSAKQ